MLLMCSLYLILKLQPLWPIPSLLQSRHTLVILESSYFSYFLSHVCMVYFESVSIDIFTITSNQLQAISNLFSVY
jgi:hypothetical protein